MNGQRQRIIEFLWSDDGPTATEYAVMLAIIAVGALVSLAAFGDRMNNLYLNVAGSVDVF
ncbi:MAG: Flp family type IVb pilin [Phycisphaerae bacterium]